MANEYNLENLKFYANSIDSAIDEMARIIECPCLHIDHGHDFLSVGVYYSETFMDVMLERDGDYFCFHFLETKNNPEWQREYVEIWDKNSPKKNVLLTRSFAEIIVDVWRKNKDSIPNVLETLRSYDFIGVSPLQMGDFQQEYDKLRIFKRGLKEALEIICEDFSDQIYELCAIKYSEKPVAIAYSDTIGMVLSECLSEIYGTEFHHIDNVSVIETIWCSPLTPARDLFTKNGVRNVRFFKEQRTFFCGEWNGINVPMNRRAFQSDN